MALRPCLDCGTPARGSRCPRDQREHERRRGSATERGYDSAWRKLTIRAKAAQPWCSACGTTRDLTVDHRDPSTKGRADLTLADVDVLCRSCNSRKGARRSAHATSDERNVEILVG
jgi:5-methylcytosine-specific restriction enzyme A